MEVKRIGVLPAWTGRGLGAVILETLEDMGRNAGMAGAQLAIRVDQPRLVSFYTSLGYGPADDVALTTVNPLSPPPVGMRKRFPRDRPRPVEVGREAGAAYSRVRHRGASSRDTQGGCD